MAHARKRILLVDDDPDVPRMLQALMPAYEFAVVADAESALDRAREFRPDLIILDVVLPRMSGTSLADRLRTHPDFARTPLFLISGMVEGVPRSPEPVRINGLTAFTKPFDVAVLKRHIHLHLSGEATAAAAIEPLKRGRLICD
jgi:DNA-binding response OmpR family regulator